MLAARDDVLEGATVASDFAAPVFADERLRRAFNTAFDSATKHGEDSDGMVAETSTLRLVALLAVNLSSKSRRPTPTSFNSASRWRAD